MRQTQKWIQAATLWMLLMAAAACEPMHNHAGKTPLASVDNQYLYLEEVLHQLPHNLSGDDSTAFVQNYIHQWLAHTLLMQKAEQNVSEDDNIAALVENYRQELILQNYRRKLLVQRLSAEVPDQEIADYYAANPSLFRLDDDVLKGRFIKVPLTAPHLNKVRRWIKSDKQDEIDELERYSLSHALLYSYFCDHWVHLGEVASKMPLNPRELASRLAPGAGIEAKDSSFLYLLSIDSVRRKGENMPLEFARNDVKDIVLNLKRARFMEQVQEDLYREAEQHNRIKIFEQ